MTETAPPPTGIAADDRWHHALDAVGAVRGDRDAAFAALTEAHAGPERLHHDLAHASAVVDAVLAVHSPGDAWAPTVLAAWYHDAVYDPRAPQGTSEGRSAVLATRVLTDLGATRTAVGEVARLICLTADHDPPAGDRTGELLCDADLSVLAEVEEAYDAYVAGVRAEYHHVADADWVVGRRRVLRSFLDRPVIFRTTAGRARWEARARINISRELSQLG